MCVSVRKIVCGRISVEAEPLLRECVRLSDIIDLGTIFVPIGLFPNWPSGWRRDVCVCVRPDSPRDWCSGCFADWCPKHSRQFEEPIHQPPDHSEVGGLWCRLLSTEQCSQSCRIIWVWG
jgi:hypothetical protein